MKFENLSLLAPLAKAVSAAGYETATPIQAQAIPQVLSGRDVLGCAQTGTGKTAAFTLPTLQRLLSDESDPTSINGDNWKLLPKANQAPKQDDRRRSKGPKGRRGGRFEKRGDRSARGRFRWAPDGRPIRALILAPTRELAVQIADSISKYGRFTELRQTCIFGGVKQGPQVNDLQAGVDIVVATPGRLLDLTNQGFVKLSNVQTLILDEADQMLDMGFLPDLTKIISKVPSSRQTLMFSATMSPEIRELADKWLNRPIEISVNPVASTPERVTQSVYFVDRQHKAATLNWYLQSNERSRTLVFSRTKRGADKIARTLELAGVNAVAIHGDKSQARRQAVIRQFKSNRPPVLVATDLAARGLDFSDISHVINYDLPDAPETYVHRIGRTARAGASGKAVSFCGRDERGRLRLIERLMGLSVQVERAPQDVQPYKPEKPRTEKNSQRPNKKFRPKSEKGEYGYSDKPKRTRSKNEHTEQEGTGNSRPKRTKSANAGSRPAKFNKKRSFNKGGNSANSDQRGGEKRTFEKPRYEKRSSEGQSDEARSNESGKKVRVSKSEWTKKPKVNSGGPKGRRTSKGAGSTRFKKSQGSRPGAKGPRKFSSSKRG